MNNDLNNINTQPVIVKKSSGFSILIIVVLTTALICSLGYIFYSKLYENNEKKVTTKELLNTTEIDASGLFQIEDTIKTFENAYNDSHTKYFGYIYSKDKITSDDFDQGAALFASIYNKYENAPVMSYVSNRDVKNTFNSIFDNSKTYTPENIVLSDNHTIVYNKNTNYYESLYAGVGGYFFPTYFSTTESTRVGDGDVFVIKNVGYIEYVDNGLSINIYSDSKKKSLIKNIKVKEGSFNPEELVARYKSKLAEYTYTFKINGDNYTFSNIKRTR